jgi:hypothetical protein
MYRLTAETFEALIPEKHRNVVDKTVGLINETGTL